MNDVYDYRALAAEQGVSRPFEILCQMPPASRRLIARALRLRLPPTDPDRSGRDAEAWAIINCDLKGLQARTHHIFEQLSPFARNNNWWEIVTRTARWLGVSFYPGVKEEEVERLVFEWLATRFDAELDDETRAALARITETNPELCRALASMRLSDAAMRAVLAAIALASVERGRSIEEGATTANGWIEEHLGRSWTTPITRSLELLRSCTTEIYETWLARPVVGLGALTSRRGAFAATLAVIYFHDLIDRTIDELAHAGV